MLVSVIIPTMATRQEELRRALTSVREDSIDIEVLVASGFPGPHQEQLQAQVPGLTVRFLLHDGETSASANRNYALDFASGEFIAFLDDDDEFMPNKLITQINEMNRSRAMWSFSNYLLSDEAKSGELELVSARTMLRRRLDFTRNCAIATPTVMVRREFLEQRRLRFDETLKVREDIDLWRRMLIEEPPLFVPVALSLVHRRVNSSFQVEQVFRWQQALNALVATAFLKKLRRYQDYRDVKQSRCRFVHPNSLR